MLPSTHVLRAVIGAIGGIVATGPMTAAMIVLHRRLPWSERYPLPPREITMKLARRTGLAPKMNAAERSAATLIAHFAYGAAAGALYALGAKHRRGGTAAATGTVFGLGVWSASYLGLLPGAGVLSSATKHPARRNALMIAAHVIWGVSLGLLVALFEEEAEEKNSPLSTSPAPHLDGDR